MTPPFTPGVTVIPTAAGPYPRPSQVGCVTIDTVSEPGSWARALKHREQVAGDRQADELGRGAEGVAVHAGVDAA